MFESPSGASAAVMLWPGPADAVLETASLVGWTNQLARLDRSVGDAERIEQIRALEELKSAAAAAGGGDRRLR
jgi:hypothetical protein